MKTINIRHEIFIREMIAHGNRIKAYQTAYPGSSAATASANSSRLINAIPEIRGRIKDAVEAVQEEVSLNLADAYEDKLAGILEKRAFLAQVIRKKPVLPRIVRRQGRESLEYRVATVSQLLTAIDLDTKLENLMQIIDSESLRRSPALKSD